MPEQARHVSATPRARASTAATQNASGGQWSENELIKPKHMRTASEMSSVTVTFDSGKSFTSEKSATTLVNARRSDIRTMQQDGGTRRRADNTTIPEQNTFLASSVLTLNQPADTRAPMDAYSLEALVDRLLRRPTSEADARFIFTFLCLYRKFAAPSEVISILLTKFEDMGNDNETPHLLRLATQLRSLTILVHWLNEYPGDFANPTTSVNLINFAKSLAATPEFSYSSRELMALLDNLKPDEDTDWACSDRGRGRASTTASFSSVPSLKISLPTTLGNVTLSPSAESVSSSLTSTDECMKTHTTGSFKKPGSRHSESSSITSSVMEREASTSGSMSNLANPYDGAQRQANMLLRQTRMKLNKTHWHDFLAIDDDVIAKELTRIDWLMYSAVRPRDLIRHINLSGEERANCKGLEHIDRMIAHFNHVASWLAEMILLRDKPKHRARMFEKCMVIAWKLRQMNNYNGVGAFVAGLGNVAISRLQQSKSLVDTTILKNFMRLEILMSMTKGYFTYRLAWDNTSSEKIPFLPLHRHDLVVAEEGSPTFSDNAKTKVNWTKFDTMGKSLWDIQKSQKTHFPGLSRNVDVQRLLMDGSVGEDVDDALYDRSLYLEPGPRSDNSRRRSGWLR